MGQHFADVRIFPERAVRNADADRQLARPGIGMDKVQRGYFFQDALCATPDSIGYLGNRDLVGLRGNWWDW